MEYQIKELVNLTEYHVIKIDARREEGEISDFVHDLLISMNHIQQRQNKLIAELYLILQQDRLTKV